jgi:REP element-mobilizing transposase RayT
MTHPPRRTRTRLHPEVYEAPGIVMSLTMCTRDRKRVFSDDQAATALVASIRELHNSRWSVLAFCVMPDHVHVLLTILERSAIEFVRLLKGRATVALRSLGHRNLWQTSFYDHVVRRDEDINAVMRYILENPVRQGLVEDWTEYRWSGSLEWPGIDAEFFDANPGDVLWSEILKGPGGGG